MNQVTIVQALNPSSGERYPELAIDGKVLDVLLHELYPQHNLLDMVPTLLHWLDDEKERAVVWSRILPVGPEKVLSPILMCGDDMDFWCTLKASAAAAAGVFL